MAIAPTSKRQAHAMALKLFCLLPIPGWLDHGWGALAVKQNAPGHGVPGALQPCYRAELVAESTETETGAGYSVGLGISNPCATW